MIMKKGDTSVNVDSITVDTSQNASIMSPMTDFTPLVTNTEHSATSSGPSVTTISTLMDLNGNKEVLSSNSPRRGSIDIKEVEKKFDEGYDTDGEVGPFYDPWIEEGDQVFDKEGLQEQFTRALKIVGEDSLGGGRRRIG